MDESLFSSLAHHKPTEQKTPLENFATQALCWLLQYSKEQGTELFPRFLKFLPNSPNHIDPKSFSVEPRASYPLSRKRGKVYPDITIKMNESVFLLIEVKVEAPIGRRISAKGRTSSQIKNYIDIAERIQGKPSVAILSKYVIDSDEVDAKHKLRWHDIAALFGETSAGNQIESFLIDQFVGFLEVNGMAVGKVTKKLEDGWKPMANLMNQIEQELESFDIRRERFYDEQWIGFSLAFKEVKDGVNLGVGVEDTGSLVLDSNIGSVIKKVKASTAKDNKLGWVVSEGHDENWVANYFEFKTEKFFDQKTIGGQQRILRDWLRPRLIATGFKIKGS